MCDEICFDEGVSGATVARPTSLKNFMNEAGPGDEIVIWRYDPRAFQAGMAAVKKAGEPTGMGLFQKVGLPVQSAPAIQTRRNRR